MYCDAMYTTNGLTDRNNWATQFQAPPGPSKSMQSPIHLESPCHGWRCWNKQNWFVSNLCTAKFDDGHVGPRPLTNLHIYLWNPYVIITAWWFQTFLIFHILGRLIPTDFHIFQRCWNHQPDHHFGWLKHVQTQFGNVAQLVPAGPRSNKQPAMVAAPKWSYSCWGKSKFCRFNQSVHDPHGSVDDFLQIPPFSLANWPSLVWFLFTVGSQSYIDLSGRLKSDSLWSRASGLSQDGTASPRPRKGVLGQKCSSCDPGMIPGTEMLKDGMV